MTWIDHLVVAVFLAMLLVIGFALSRRAGKSTEEFILGGRRLPWWLAGTSMSATGLNASTMLQDSRKIRQDGISGMWFTWGSAIGGMISAVWFNRLWRRARFTTQMEFFHARYTGWTATFARIYSSVVYGVVVAAVWAAVGLVGMKKIAHVILDLPTSVMLLGFSVPTDALVVLGLVVVTLIYSAASGVHGIVWTDLIEFLIAMVAAYVLLFLVFREVGWSTGLRTKIEAMPDGGSHILRMLPAAGPVLLYYMIIGPIINQGGYNPHIQRLLGVKNEREVLYTALYASSVNFVFRSWPFYICGLCGLFLISDADLLSRFGGIPTPDGQTIPDYEKVFPALVQTYLPVGLVGVMVAGFLSAFMSSFDTNIHNSASIFVNDLYRPYLARGRTDKHYVSVSRYYLVFITAVASLIGFLVKDILMLTMLAFAVTQSIGLVTLLRFIWWRVNGPAEVAAQIVSIIVSILFISPLGRPVILWLMGLFNQSGNDAFFVTRQFLLMGGSSLAAVLAVFLFKPEPMEHLCAFYRRVRPFGWWGPVRRALGDDAPAPDSMFVMSALTLAGIAFIFGLVFATLSLFLAFWTLSAISLAVALASLPVFRWGIRRLYPEGSAALREGA